VLAALAPAGAVASDDLRSPDARHPFVAPAAATPDLRSPDARDAAQGRGAAGSPRVLVARMPEYQSSGDGMDWGDAGIGAGGVVAVLVLTAGGNLALQRRRQVASTNTPAAA
jgi:hypothetical protein